MKAFVESEWRIQRRMESRVMIKCIERWIYLWRSRWQRMSTRHGDCGRWAQRGTQRVSIICLDMLDLETSVQANFAFAYLSCYRHDKGAFIINHTASYRPQTQVARHMIAANHIGKIRHISAYMNGVRIICPSCRIHSIFFQNSFNIACKTLDP